ncbi:MAG: hypothetical protein JW820_03620, partial [Spirochaetales bacterium]|nr:hypothetical protein [Spirochaetales bacterium]
PNAGCVLSADLEGLNFQTYLEWQAADSIAVMRAESALIAPSADLQYVLPEAPFPYTCYAFLLGGFQPVSRDDLYFWYCSKVPWWVYAHGLSINIENEDFYEFGDPHGKWTAFEDSLLFKVYKLYLRLTLSWRDWWKIPYLTEKKLKEVLGELITPDELRWPVADGPLSCVHTYGDDSPDYDWEDYGVTP